jgi:hypothetical protein
MVLLTRQLSHLKRQIFGRFTLAQSFCETKPVQIEGGVINDLFGRRRERVEIDDEDGLFREPVNPDEQIVARRATVDEYLAYISKVEFLDGRMMTNSGVELFVGVEQFPKALRALEQEQAEMQGKSLSKYLREKDKS